MSIKRILWVLAAFAFTSVLYAQVKGAAPVTPAAPVQPQTPTANQTANQEQEKVQKDQTGSKTQAQAKPPSLMTQKEVEKECKSSPPETVLQDVKMRGVDFELTPGIEKKLRKAGATDAIVEAVRKLGPKGRANTARMSFGPGAGGVTDVPKEQAQDFDAIKSELDPDKSITLVDRFIKRYPDSALLSYVYSFGASAYQQKGDVDKVIDYTGKGLKLRPDDLLCLVLRIGILPQPQYLNKHEADRESVLKEAETDANRAMELILKLPKQPNEDDEDYQKRRADIASQVHAALGMVHLDRATSALVGVDKGELVKAEQELQVAVTTTPRPDPRDYYRLGETYAMDGKLDNAIEAFTKASELGQGTTIKAYADRQVEELKKKKAQRSAVQKP